MPGKILKPDWLLTAMMLVFVGCRSYEPAPVDWTRESAVWMEQGELVFSSLDDVARMALVGNAELNRMRLGRASADRVAAATGRWDDPEIDADLLRIVDPSSNPWLGGVSMSFTIPLSGAKGCERRAAEAYAAADAAEIVAAERETDVAARCAVLRLQAARETIRMLKGFEDEPRIVDAYTSAERLSAAGEISRTESASARLRRHQRLHRLRQAESAADEAERSLRLLLGVSPGVKMRFERLSPSSSPDLPDPADPLAYTHHPGVRAAVCRLEGGEAALEAEIRRQYPNLKLGPAYSREDGTDRFGIVAGMTLPLWNRNRRGIAEAEGTRDEARAKAIGIWREIVLEADAARRTLARLRNHPPETPPDRESVNVLYDAGEITPLEYLAAREEALDGALMEHDWRRDVRLAEEKLRKYEL